MAVSALAFVAREVTATMRVGLAAGRGWRPRARLGAHSREDAVILVHGFMATAHALAPIARHLHSELGVDVHSFTYAPGATLDAIAARIHEATDALEDARRIHLVGHSLGGLAARWYVQEHTHDPRIVQTISVASPFLGLELANRLPELLRAVVLPVDAQLARIVAEAPRHLARVPHLSVLADKDQLIWPATNAILPGAPSYVLHDTGHNGSLFQQRLFDVVMREIARLIPPEELGG
jgi:alpha-beta hydrolase superfamily lysophospholipase